MTRLIQVICAILVCVSSSRAQPGSVSRQPPAGYEKFLAPLLTPLDEALVLSRDLKPDPEFGGAVILSEILHRVDADGGRLIAVHSIYRADTAAGAESLGDDTQAYSSASQKIHLALARTISPDGTHTPVRPNAALIQSPQRSADQSLYSDSQELVIVYPKIKPGTLTESIIVIEEKAMRVPGEFMTSIGWAGGWPQGRKRLIIDLPEGLGNRIKISALGTGTPEAERSEPTAGRVRFDLQRDGAIGYLYEIGRSPVSQSGPATWITTLSDWDAFADWYRPLLEERSKLGAQLAAKVDEWTDGAKDDDEIIARLLLRAANDIRYTGLEFGISGLQPYDCNEVWENQYGDCKDKSNLLHAMLGHKGIKSYLTLLNTEHAGRIEKRSPDYRQFNHAILAVERAGGGFVFCDPTIAFARPGLLRPDDGGRDVLVIRDERGEFARTPPSSAGQLDYAFDLDLSAAREVSGWMTLTGRGFYAANYAAFYSKMDPQALNQSLARVVTDFFPTAEVADVERPDLGGWDGAEYRLRAYFVAPGADKGELSLTFPYSEGLFPQLGDTRTRHAPFYGWADQASIDATIRVPAELGSPGLPDSLVIDSSAISGEASWGFSQEKGHYRGRLDFQVKKPMLSPAEFQVAFGAINSMRSWLAVPLIFDASKARPAPADGAKVVVENFPLMPTAQGQLNLLDQRFPSDGNRAQRRAALLKVLQFFPNDLKTRFAVESNLAELAWNDGDNAGAIARILKLLNSAASDAVGDEDRGWAEYVLGFCYRDDGNPERAKQVFKEIAQNAEVSEFRRSWAGYQRLSLLKREKEPDYDKLASETNALIDYQTEARAYLVALHGDFMSRAGKSEALGERLDDLVEQKPEDLTQIIELLCSVAQELPAAQSDGLAAVIRGLPLADGSPAAEMRETALDALATFRESASSYAAIQVALRAFLDENRPEAWGGEGSEPTTADQLAKRLDTSENSSPPADYIPIATRYLTEFAPGERFPYFLWRLAAWCEFAERSGDGIFKSPALPLLLDLCDQLPESDDYYVEGKFLRARYLAGQEKFAAETAVFEELLESGLLSTDAFLIAAISRFGASLERQGKFDAAREQYLKLKPYTADYALANEALLNATLISLELGEQPAAIEILKHLATTKPEVLELTANGGQIRSMTALKAPEAYWKASQNWWAEWERLHAKLCPDEKLEAVRVPSIGNLQAFGSGLRGNVRAKDTDAFYSQLDLLLRALRWSPDFLNDTGSTITFLATSISPDSASDLRKLMISICQHFPDPSPENLRRVQLYQSLALIDSGENEEALPITVQFFEAAPVRDPVYFSMVRLRAISASRVDGADLETPARALENVLASKDNDENRLQNVLQLAKLYNLLGQPEKEEALLAREIEHPAIKANGRAATRLRLRHQSLAREGSAAKDFTAAVDSWLAEHAPAWLAHCRPADLSDPRIGDSVERALKEAASRFSPEEVIRFSSLAARSEKLSLRDRERAFITVFMQLLGDATTHRQARAMITDILDHEGLPKSLKQIALFSALDDAIGRRRAGDAAFLLAHPSLDRENERLADIIELYGQLAAADFGSSKSLAEAVALIAADGLTSAELGGVMQCFQRMLELGDLEAANAIYRTSGNWKLDPDVRVTSQAIKLNFLKVLKFARKTIPITQGLHAQLAPMLEFEEAQEPDWFAQRRHFDDTTDLSIGDARALRLQQVKLKRYDQTDPRFWFDVADSIQGPDSVDFAYKLLETYLAKTDDDGRRSGAAFLAPGIVDTDEPAVRERLQKIFAPYRNLADAPLTRDAIRLYEIQSAIRCGDEVEVDRAFAGLTHPAAAPRRIHAKLTKLIQDEDRPKLRQYLERLTADQLLDEDFLPLTIRALDLAGLEDEAELARETAAEKIPTLVAEGWRVPRTGSLRDAYTLATILKQPDLIPGAALGDLIAHGLQNERRQLGLKMVHYQLHQDWPKLAAAASEAIAAFPTFYSFYLDRARALYHLGKKREAVAPLKVYLKYCSDEVEITLAKRWLEEIEQEEEEEKG